MRCASVWVITLKSWSYLFTLRLQLRITAAYVQGSDFSPPSDLAPPSSSGWPEEDESDGEEDFSARVRPRLVSNHLTACANKALQFTVGIRHRPVRQFGTPMHMLGTPAERPGWCLRREACPVLLDMPGLLRVVQSLARRHGFSNLLTDFKTHADGPSYTPACTRPGYP